MLAVRDLSDPFGSFVYEQTEGHPFFIGEYVRALVEDARWIRRSAEATWEFPDLAGALEANGRSKPVVFVSVFVFVFVVAPGDVAALFR